MRIADLYGAEGGPVLSLEFFTPKNEAGRKALFRAVERLGKIRPGFVSITCGAAGTTRERTADLAIELQDKFGLTAMAHLVCTGTTEAELEETLRHMQANGIDNILALRGDPPKGATDWTPVEGGFRHADELAAFVKERFSLGIGGACYPETHPEATSPQDDLRFARMKQDLGASFLTTQLFFDCSHYWSYVERARAAGIAIPIVPGIMPVTNVAQIERFTKMCGASLPEPLLDRLRPIQDDPGAVMATGIEYAVTQCRELLERGAPGIHFYTLNKSHATRSVLAGLR